MAVIVKQAGVSVILFILFDNGENEVKRSGPLGKKNDCKGISIV